ncbi:MAG: solute-binding protein [Chloroflexi bacterium]|nr:substrate-binding domain-containing protein [Ardenticatenaceae bacterium]MBL1128201.1 VWA domain-containing protein [Chloroflexota bacterium]NOG34274.1 solute-binding protein [Chloroflexota bacterium]GIK56388.1 MAG: VWA domain-containing protein [Chloroflexota bacterium]
MDRTRIIFVVIVVIALCIVGVMVGVQVIGNLVEGANTSQTDAETRAPQVDVPAGGILVTVESSNTKEAWMKQMEADFNAAGMKTSNGRPIAVQVTHGTSGGAMDAILDGTLQPVAWSPGDQSWVDQANDTWRQRTNKPLASQPCPATVYAPLGFAMWKPMAETLGWPNEPIGWDTIVALAEDPNGWASYSRPEWGQFRFGHTHPAYANSGLLAMTSFVYGVTGKTDTLTAADVYAPEVEEAMRALEQVTSKYGRQAPAILDAMARQGPSYLHAAAVPEAEVVRFNIERGDELAFPLIFIFPAGGAIWADQPYCVLDNADWVDAEEAEAATIFRDFILARAQQEKAIDNFLRPLDPSIPLRAPLTMANGTDPNVTPRTVALLPSPNAAVSNAVIDLFNITKRKATILLVLDVSGSMQGDRINTARAATVEFLNRLDANDEVGLIVFSNDVTMLAEPARVGDVVEGLSQRVNGLIADGNTALYGAVCEAVAQMETLRAEDLAAGESRLYGIILLSDGEDTVGRPTENQMFATCLPANAEADGVRIYPIAFGNAADVPVLERVANVTGGRMFTAAPTSISNVYLSISAEQ